MISNYKAGVVTLSPLGTYGVTWPQQFPASGSLVGSNLFSLHGEDITPAPFNQPPFAPSGDVAADTCVVVGLTP